VVRELTESLRLEYLKDPELWLAIVCSLRSCFVAKWLSGKVFQEANVRHGCAERDHPPGSAPGGG
jgi:hypothetical protein